MVGDIISVTPGSNEFDSALCWLEERGVKTFGAAAVIAERMSSTITRFRLVLTGAIGCESPFSSVEIGDVQVQHAPSFFRSPSERAQLGVIV